MDVFPQNKEIRFVAARSELRPVTIPDPQRRRLYDETLYRLALAILYMLFDSDEAEALDSIIFNGWVLTVDRASGNETHPCILSIQVQRDEFLDLDLAHVDPRLCFKKLKGVSGARLAELVPVQPVLSLNTHDPRFVQGYSVVDTLLEGDNLASMDWLDFENLIRELFEKDFSR